MKKLFSLIIFIIVFFSFSQSVSADIGPKPSVKLHIKNPPEGFYYVDFLVPDEKSYTCDYNNENLEYWSQYYNTDMLKILLNYHENGYHARLRGDFGVDFGVVKSSEEHTYDFIYMVPDEFKIIIVTEDLQVIISPLVRTRMYNASVTFDAASGTAEESKSVIAEDMAKSALQTLILFLITCSFTILIEWIVFRCFRIEIRKAWNPYNARLFRITNIATQIFLYIMLEISGSLFTPTEIIIALAESIIFALKMKDTKKARIIISTLFANAVSFLLSTPTAYILLFIENY